MSLGVAIQSVIYYIAACSACHKYTHRRRRKREAANTKSDHVHIETEEPGLYRHPSPFHTNRYWGEELALGPGPTQRKSGKKGASKASSQRQLLTAGAGSSHDSSAGGTPGASMEKAVPHGPESGEGWNMRRYQREDETLWGREEEEEEEDSNMPSWLSRSHSGRDKNCRGSSVGTDSVGKPERVYRHESRNPPVNELHPPVVSTQPVNRGATRWMLQPPPSAKIMNGKERAVESRRSRSSSGNSQTQKVTLEADYTGLLPVSGKPSARTARKREHNGPEVALLQPKTSLRKKRIPRRSSASLSAEGQPHDREIDERDRPASFFDTISRDSSQRRRQRLSMRSIASSSEESLEIVRRESRRPVKRYSAVRRERVEKRGSVTRAEQPPRTPSQRSGLNEPLQALSDLTPTFNKRTNRGRPLKEINPGRWSGNDPSGSSADSFSPREDGEWKGAYEPRKPSFIPQSPASF